MAKSQSRSLTPNERKLLCAVLHETRQAVSKVASEAGMRQHTAAYCLQQLKERGVITPYILTNPHAVRLTDYCIFFNYLGEAKQARRKIIEFCSKSQQVAYFAELSGPYQFSVSLFCATIFEVTNFFAKLSAILPRSSFERSFAIRLEFTQFLGKLGESKKNCAILKRTETAQQIAIDEIDRKILGFYSQHAETSLQKVAAFAGVSETTVRNRLAVLEKNSVIEAYPYVLDVSKVGMTTYRFIIAAKGMEQSFRSEIYNYATRHPSCSAFVHCAGAWDFELNFDVEESSEMGEILEDVRDQFGSNIRSIHSISELKVIRAHHFPLDAGKR